MNRYVRSLFVFPAIYALASFTMYDVNAQNWPIELRGIMCVFGPLIYIMIATAPHWDD